MSVLVLILVPTLTLEFLLASERRLVSVSVVVRASELVPDLVLVSTLELWLVSERKPVLILLLASVHRLVLELTPASAPLLESERQPV